jgi:hypothetical protein
MLYEALLLLVIGVILLITSCYIFCAYVLNTARDFERHFPQQDLTDKTQQK